MAYHKRNQARRIKMTGQEPSVEQGEIDGFTVSWNPDDDRFYVQSGEDTRASFQDWRNVVQYCRTHKP